MATRGNSDSVITLVTPTTSRPPIPGSCVPNSSGQAQRLRQAPQPPQVVPTHTLRARDTSSATHPSAYDNSNGWANPPLPRYLATAHPTSINMGVALTRSNEWVSEATRVVSAGHRRICHGCGVGFANPYRTRAESEVFLTPLAVSRSFVFTRRTCRRRGPRTGKPCYIRHATNL
jgi:hypothetical protein